MRTKKLRNLSFFKYCILLLILICSTLCSVSLYAAADTKVYDYANLFSLDELETLETSASELAETYQMDIGIVTTNDTNNLSSETYADDFYDNNGYGYGANYDGLLLLIDMEHRMSYISTCGSGIQYFTDLRISKMLDSVNSYLADAKYYDAAVHFLENVTSYMQSGIPSNQYSTDRAFSDPREDDHKYNMTKPETPHVPFTTPDGEGLNIRSVGLSILVALLGAAVIALIVRCIVKYTYTHPAYTKPATIPDDLSVSYNEREDRFVTSHTTKVKIQTNNTPGGGGSSGRSSTHRSSSGRSHGGGGRGF